MNPLNYNIDNFLYCFNSNENIIIQSTIIALHSIYILRISRSLNIKKSRTIINFINLLEIAIDTLFFMNIIYYYRNLILNIIRDIYD